MTKKIWVHICGSVNFLLALDACSAALFPNDCPSPGERSRPNRTNKLVLLFLGLTPSLAISRDVGGTSSTRDDRTQFLRVDTEINLLRHVIWVLVKIRQQRERERTEIPVDCKIMKKTICNIDCMMPGILISGFYVANADTSSKISRKFIEKSPSQAAESE